MQPNNKRSGSLLTRRKWHSGTKNSITVWHRIENDNKINSYIGTYDDYQRKKLRR